MESALGTGALFQTGGAVDVIAAVSSVPNVAVERVPVTGWLEIVLTSETPLVQENDAREFKYRFLYRKGANSRFLLVAGHSGLVDLLLQRAGVLGVVRRPTVHVDNIVKQLTSQPSRYVLSAVHARVEGFEHGLRNAAFWGNDLAEAALFRQILPYLSAYRVTLRELTRRIDVLSIGSGGEVGVPFQHRRLRYTDEALMFLSQRRYLDWDGEPTATHGEVSG